MKCMTKSLDNLLRKLSSSWGLYYLLLVHWGVTKDKETLGEAVLCTILNDDQKQLFIRWVCAEQEHLFCNYRFKHTKISELPNRLASLCHPSRQIARVQIPKGIQLPKATNPCQLQNQPLLSSGIKALAIYITIVKDNTLTVQFHNAQL